MMELNGSAWKIQQPRFFHEMMTKLKKKTKKNQKTSLLWAILCKNGFVVN